MADWSVTAGNGLRLDATLDAQSPVFRAFFEGYDRAFVLPDEKEDEEGFALCLALNRGAAYARLEQAYGPFREVCAIATDGAGKRIGGVNFIAAPASIANGEVFVCANLNYIYIDAAARGQGNFRKLVAATTELIASLFPAAGGPLVFIEQNDPIAMSADAYAHDTQFTGLDQIDRLRIWAKAGAKVVDHPYVQPPLSPEQGADETLVYSVLGAAGDALPACVLAGHLKRFFGISVLKGAPLDEAPVAAAQVAALEAACRAGAQIALFDPAPALARMPNRDAAMALTSPPPRRFRDLLAPRG